MYNIFVGRKENKAASLFLEGIKKSVDNTSVVRTRRPASEGTFEQRQQNEDVKKVAEHLVEKFKHLLSSAPNEQIFTGNYLFEIICEVIYMIVCKILMQLKMTLSLTIFLLVRC